MAEEQVVVLPAEAVQVEQPRRGDILGAGCRRRRKVLRDNIQCAALPPTLRHASPSHLVDRWLAAEASPSPPFVALPAKANATHCGSLTPFALCLVHVHSIGASQAVSNASAGSFTVTSALPSLTANFPAYVCVCCGGRGSARRSQSVRMRRHTARRWTLRVISLIRPPNRFLENIIKDAVT